MLRSTCKSSRCTSGHSAWLSSSAHCDIMLWWSKQRRICPVRGVRERETEYNEKVSPRPESELTKRPIKPLFTLAGRKLLICEKNFVIHFQLLKLSMLSMNLCQVLSQVC